LTHDIAIIVSTYERPLHLTRCLESIAAQQGVEGRFEVVVTDDGSRDETLRVVAAAARQAEFPLAFTTHDHQGFRLARCRNEGVAASTAPYLLFTDGDCLLPPDHVRIHLDKRREGYVNAGDCLRLDESTSERIDLAAIGDGSFTALMPAAELRRIRWKARRGKAYEWLRMPMRPRLSGNNIAVWRSDLERINGFDEQFVGWGFEDRDLQQRLEQIGVRTRSILGHTATLHLWHPLAPSFARNGAETENLRYFRRRDRPSFCRDGLMKPNDTVETIRLPKCDAAFEALHRQAA
jgi:glycosyltransferase involved in cell wall biosynthesis